MNQLSKTIWIATASLLLLVFVAILLTGTTTFADVFRGYEMIFQYKDGAQWNTLNYPTVHNPEQTFFVAWWAPGQWMLPYFLLHIIGIPSFHLVQAVLIITCLSCALYGYKLLFQKIGFSPLVVSLALFSIVSNQLFYWHAFMFYGGDLFLLALFPYFALLLLYSADKFSVGIVVLFFLTTGLGLFFKNTFLVIAFSALFFLFFAPKKIGLKQRIYRVLPYLIGLLILFLLFSKMFLSLGETPGTASETVGYNNVPNTLIGDISYALGHPLGIFSRLTFIIQKVLKNNLWQLLPLAFTIWFFISYGKKAQRKYFDLLVWWAGPFSLFFMFMYLQDKAISYEMRHFAPFAFLFFPGIIERLLNVRFKKIGFATILCLCLMDLGMGIMSFRKIETSHTFWKHLKVDKEDADLLTAIETWDKSTQNGCLLMEDYWMPSLAVRNNHKWVLTKHKAGFGVVSGMELDHAPIFTNLPIFNYDNLLVVTSRNNPSLLPSNLKEYSIISEEKTANWVLIKLKRTN